MPITKPAMSGQPAPSGKSSSTLVVALVLAVVGFGAGYMLATKTQKKVAYDEGYRAGSTDTSSKVQATLKDSGLFPEFTGPVTSISGIVKSVDGMTLTVETPSLTRNPLDAQTPLMRSINVTASTKLFKQEAFSAAEAAAMQAKFEATLAAFQKDPTGSPPTPPISTQRTSIMLKDITTGANIVITAADDIRLAESFDAVEIDLLPESPTSPPPSATPGTPGPGEIPPPPPPTR